jgi:5'-nucleotidase
MSKKPFLLITNDDGINAPGIRHLWECVHENADISIVAPDRERSGSGMSITWKKPLHIEPFNWEGGTKAWSLNGTPADCVKMGCSVLLDDIPDMVISGINRGSNAGRTIFYSGTVAGVIEAALRGIPGIAFSYCDLEMPPVECARPYVLPLIKHLLANPLPKGTFLNVNFPENFVNKVKGFRLTRHGKGYWSELPDRRMHPQGLPYYWLGGKWSAHDEEEESDVSLLSQGYITAVPVQVNDLTNREALNFYKERLTNIFSLEGRSLQEDLAGETEA